MNTTTSTATTDRNSRARRAKSSSNYILTGIRTMIAATAILFAAAGYALAGSPQALRVANGTNVVEFGSLPHGTHDPNQRSSSTAPYSARRKAWSSIRRTTCG